jgi:DNA-binding transcriptional LysR family regulator
VIGAEATVELRTFRYFVAVADAGSVNAAAQSLHLTQPSLARQLHRLERRLALPLLELRGGRTVLTGTGHQFLPYARALLATADATLVVAGLLAANLRAEDELSPEDETAA